MYVWVCVWACKYIPSSVARLAADTETAGKKMDIAHMRSTKDRSDLEKKIIMFIRRAGLMGQVTVRSEGLRAEVERKRAEDDDDVMQVC